MYVCVSSSTHKNYHISTISYLRNIPSKQTTFEINIPSLLFSCCLILFAIENVYKVYLNSLSLSTRHNEIATRCNYSVPQTRNVPYPIVIVYLYGNKNCAMEIFETEYDKIQIAIHRGKKGVYMHYLLYTDSLSASLRTFVTLPIDRFCRIRDYHLILGFSNWSTSTLEVPEGRFSTAISRSFTISTRYILFKPNPFGARYIG